MKTNDRGKCYVLLLTNENLLVNIGTAQIQNSSSEKLLRIKIDSNLNFKDHIGSICKKASDKLNALTIVSSGMGPDKRRLTMNDFFSSQFTYCPLTWTFHSRELNQKINRLHKRCLRIIYHETTSSFEELLQKDNSVSIHYRNIQVLATKILRVYKGTSPKIMDEAFRLSQPLNYNLKHQPDFSTRPVKGFYYGTESLGSLGYLVPAQIWHKRWGSKECSCRLCMTYIHQVDLICNINFIFLFLVFFLFLLYTLTYN